MPKTKCCIDCQKSFIFTGRGHVKRCPECRVKNKKEYSYVYSEKYRKFEVILGDEITDKNAHLKVFMGDYPDETI